MRFVSIAPAQIFCTYATGNCVRDTTSNLPSIIFRAGMSCWAISRMVKKFEIKYFDYAVVFAIFPSKPIFYIGMRAGMLKIVVLKLSRKCEFCAFTYITSRLISSWDE